MSSSDHPQSDVPAPAGDASPQVLEQQPQPTPASSSEPVMALDSSVQTEKTQQDNSVAETANTKPADVSESTAPIPATQQSNTEATASTNVVPAESGEQESVAPAPEPSSETSDAVAKEAEDSGPSLDITLLLTTGSRHPFKIDGKYLRKRNVNVENYDPFAMSVYTLKELIWREWRQDWEPRPSSPSSIRLISFGKLLEDKAPLSDSRFNHDAPNVVHMTVKPQEIVDEEDAKGAKTQYTRERETSERSPGCRCVIQ